MGFLGSVWEGTWRGHAVTVSNSHVTRGFSVEVAGRVAVKRAITLTGGGHFEGDVEVEGKSVHVVAEFVGSECELWVDGEKLALTQAK